MKMKKIILFLSGLFDPPFLEGMLIKNRYKVIGHLGSGGYGHSYLVVDQKTNQKVVLKSLRLHRRLSQSGRRGFEHEMELLKSIIHPGFPRFMESGIFKNIPFYTMEFIEGKNFEQLIFNDGKRYSELNAFKTAYQLLPMIQFLHSKKMIHRDIRIPNVISNGKSLWLIDLGLATEKASILSETRNKRRNLRKQLNDQADFYSLGHFLLFLLYSNFTFPKGSRAKSWEEELNISQQSKHIIERLLQIKTPYQSCSQIQKDIEKLILNGEEKNVVF
jgi:serine/threonine-protein kinase